MGQSREMAHIQHPTLGPRQLKEGPLRRRERHSTFGTIRDVSDKLVKDQNTGGVSSPMATKGSQNNLPDSQYNDLSEAGAEFLMSPFSKLDFESETDKSWTSSPIPSLILTWFEHRDRF